ncbi:MAG: M20 family metallopeptidase [Betaproteobacteria bacterium]|nr:M20 family metallopeptidase [Betaproteobacteria bacterium]
MLNLPNFPFLPELTSLRHDLHTHPELAFQETRTAGIIARELASYGLEVHRGLARTGVVGVLRAGKSGRMIGLRADMDALPIEERNKFSHRSACSGYMHACGHDGHVAMLLGAARHLAENPKFDGSVVFIFQPAEESEGGAKEMVDDGLFERFPVESVYGLHNWPDLPLGNMALRPGAIMAGTCRLGIRIRGQGCHAAMPHQGIDPIVAAGQLISLLHTIGSREISPLDSAVLSITQIHAGSTWNVIPDEATLGGTIRSFNTSVQEQIEAAIHRICQGVAGGTGTKIEARMERSYPPTINSQAESDICLAVAKALLGEAHVYHDMPPAMTAEDFSYMLLERPGCYVWLGTGEEGNAPLHNPGYDFNDKAIPIGIAYWASLVQAVLGKNHSSQG